MKQGRLEEGYDERKNNGVTFAWYLLAGSLLRTSCPCMLVCLLLLSTQVGGHLQQEANATCEELLDSTDHGHRSHCLGCLVLWCHGMSPAWSCHLLPPEDAPEV